MRVYWAFQSEMPAKFLWAGLAMREGILLVRLEVDGVSGLAVRYGWFEYAPKRWGIRNPPDFSVEVKKMKRHKIETLTKKV